MSLDLNKLANKLDKALSNETSETLNKFLTDKTMSNNKQSSVEWLVEILGKYNEEMVFLYQNEIEQAKAMHKEEIIQAYSNGWHDGQDAIIMKIEHIDKGGDERGLKYYEQL